VGYFFGACWTMCSGSIDTECVVLQRSCILQLAIAYALVASAHGLGRYPFLFPYMSFSHSLVGVGRFQAEGRLHRSNRQIISVRCGTQKVLRAGMLLSYWVFALVRMLSLSFSAQDTRRPTSLLNITLYVRHTVLRLELGSGRRCTPAMRLKGGCGFLSGTFLYVH
jgi:hypothetical protein